MFLKRSLKVFLIASVVLAFASAAYAYAAANVLPASKAGDGSGAINRYTISNVLINPNTTNPQNLDSVTFTTSADVPNGSTVKIRLTTSAGSTWYTCTGQGSPNISCITTSPQLNMNTPPNNLRVVIAN